MGANGPCPEKVVEAMKELGEPVRKLELTVASVRTSEVPVWVELW